MADVISAKAVRDSSYSDGERETGSSPPKIAVVALDAAGFFDPYCRRGGIVMTERGRQRGAGCEYLQLLAREQYKIRFR
jgi:hypothetical protein